MGILNYRFGLIGYPLGHSLSPVLHRAALQALGLAGAYDLYPVASGSCSQAELLNLLAMLRRQDLHGLNVTIPYKQAVLLLVDALTPVAQQVGAVNTLYVQEELLVGENTDVSGFLADLDFALKNASRVGVWESTNPTALVLGAGGSARAVVYALLQAGWSVTIAARRWEQAQELCRLGPSSIEALPLEAKAIQQSCSQVALVVNTTPVGMHPHPGISPWPAPAAFPAGAVVYDLVYNPPVTRLMHQASQAGLAVRNGLGMLVEQAALAFERWTGRQAPRQPMWEAALGERT
jgi:shikimate dehydrogenase